MRNSTLRQQGSSPIAWTTFGVQPVTASGLLYATLPQKSSCRTKRLGKWDGSDEP
jgi:hypothetical protein